MKTSLRLKADKAKSLRCKNLIVVLENPKTLENIASTVRNIDALGAEKLYVIDGNKLLPPKWEQMRKKHSLNKISVSAIKWTFVKVFPDTQSCINHLAKNNFRSIATSPHLKHKVNCVLEHGLYTMKKLAVWFGNESQGLSELAIDNSKFCVNIPMAGIIESLNLGTTTGIVLYEVVKQRREFEQRNNARYKVDLFQRDMRVEIKQHPTGGWYCEISKAVRYKTTETKDCIVRRGYDNKGRLASTDVVDKKCLDKVQLA